MYNVVLISALQQSDVVWLESVGKLLIPPSPSPHFGNQKSVLCVCVCFCFRHVLSHFSCVQLSVTPWIVAPPQAPPSIGFSREEYWNGLHALLQGNSLTQGSNSVS